MSKYGDEAFSSILWPVEFFLVKLLIHVTLVPRIKYEDCSNMNAGSFITFFIYILRQNSIHFWKKTIFRLYNGTKHKEALTIFLKLQTLI